MRKSKLPFTKEPIATVGELAFFPCYVAGEPWRYGLVTKKQMKILSDGVSTDADGLCDSQTNTIYMTQNFVTHPAVIHELCHAHMAQNQLHSANLTPDQIEEVMCDTFAYSWCRILLLSRVIVHNLLCYEEYIKGELDQDWMECPVDVIDNRLAEHLIDLCATYSTTGGINPLLKATIAKKKRKKRF